MNELFKIWIIGFSCTGKTTLANQLSRKLGIDSIELDKLYWKENWSRVSDQEFCEIVSHKLENNNWIVDGESIQIRHKIEEKCNYVIWLDLPIHVIILRYIVRSFNRIIFNSLLWNGNRESFVHAFGRNSYFINFLKKYKQSKFSNDLLFHKKYSTLKKIRVKSKNDLEKIERFF